MGPSGAGARRPDGASLLLGERRTVSEGNAPCSNSKAFSAGAFVQISDHHP